MPEVHAKGCPLFTIEHLEDSTDDKRKSYHVSIQEEGRFLRIKARFPGRVQLV